MIVRSEVESIVGEDEEEREKLCGAKKVETRQRSVRLVLDDWSTRPAVLSYWPIRSWAAANRHEPLGATITTHLWNVHSVK